MAGRDYNGLTGREIRDKMLRILDEQLQLDSRLQEHLCYHNVTLSGEFILNSWPARNAEEKFTVSLAAGDPEKALKKKPESAKLSIKEELPIPDLVREELAEQAPEDVAVITQTEQRN